MNGQKTATAPTNAEKPAPSGTPPVAPAAPPANSTPEGAEGSKETKGTPPSSTPDFSTLTIGEQSPLTTAHLDKVKDLAKKQGWTVDQAKERLAEYETVLNDNLNDANARLADEQKRWNESMKVDPTYGGENFGKTNEAVTRFLNANADPEFVTEITNTGLIHHPGFRRMLAKAGMSMLSDSSTSGAPPSGQPTDAATRMFPNSLGNQS